MTARLSTALVGGLLLFFSLAPGSVHAQDWGQTIQIFTPVEYDGALHVFLDSLHASLSRTPDAEVRRTAQDDAPTSFQDLQSLLYDEGLDLRSASHVFIRYRFEIKGGGGSGLVESVEDMYFIYRGDEARTDVPILHVSSSEAAVNDVLVNRGIADGMNMKSISSFRELVAFLSLANHPDTYLVEMSGRAIRDDHGRQRANDLMVHLDKMYFGIGAYTLTTDYEIARGDSPEPLAYQPRE